MARIKTASTPLQMATPRYVAFQNDVSVFHVFVPLVVIVVLEVVVARMGVVNTIFDAISDLQ